MASTVIDSWEKACEGTEIAGQCPAGGKADDTGALGVGRDDLKAASDRCHPALPVSFVQVPGRGAVAVEAQPDDGIALAVQALAKAPQLCRRRQKAMDQDDRQGLGFLRQEEIGLTAFGGRLAAIDLDRR